MCNLYSITTNQAAIIAVFRVINRLPLPQNRQISDEVRKLNRKRAKPGIRF